jgi:hypothetical protein
MSFKNLEGQTAGRVQRLQEYNFTFEHGKARKHKNADALSRRCCQEERTHCHKVELRADLRVVGALSALTTADWDPLILRKEQ